MTIIEINKISNETGRLLDQGAISQAFSTLLPLIDASGRDDFHGEFTSLSGSYELMLKYMSQGIVDSQRHAILAHIIRALYVLRDRCVIHLSQPSSHEVFYARRRELEMTPLRGLIDEYREHLRGLDLIQHAEPANRDVAAEMEQRQKCESTETRLFNKVWSTYPTPAEDIQQLKSFMLDSDMPAHTRALTVSALLVGMMKFYDENKLLLLLDIYSLSQNNDIQLRALTAALLTMMCYRVRVNYSPGIDNRIKLIKDLPHFSHDLWSVQQQMARQRTTTKVTQRIREELIPGIMKMSPDLFKKLKDQQSPIDISDLEANPEWKDLLDESGITRKMEEFNQLQSEGSDVFISTFAHLKTFPFFQTMSNWFLPFHSNQSVVAEALGEDSALLDVIGDAPYLCNSDKYSFCLSLGAMGAQRRQLLQGQLQEQNAALHEALRAELPDERKRRDDIINKYVMDLYRFFNLFSRRREFFPAFADDMNMLRLPMLGELTSNRRMVTLLAEFYLKNGFYDDAVAYYERLLDKDNEHSDAGTSPVIYQKLAFAHQSAGHLHEALDNYLRYELADGDDAWNLKHIAACYRALKDFDRALTYYNKAQALQPDNVSLCLNIGHCLLEQGKTAEALKQYFKADFMPEAKHRAWRPIAWCSLLEGNFDRALSYYDKIIADDKPSAEDLLNRGHVLLCQGKIKEAIAQYAESLRRGGGSKADFAKAMHADASTLQAHGISSEDICLIADASIMAGDENGQSGASH